MSVVIVAHAMAATALLVVGLLALRAPKRRASPHPRLGDVYVALLCVALPLGLVVGSRDPAISPFEVATGPTLALGIGGWLAARLRPVGLLGRPWIAWHISGMGGSYIGVVTAGAFQTIGRVSGGGSLAVTLIFALPSLVGTVLIQLAIARRVRRPRPAGPLPAA